MTLELLTHQAFLVRIYFYFMVLRHTKARRVTTLICTILGMSTLLCVSAFAQNHSINESGIIGLNTAPSARMDKKGTIRLGMGTSDPHAHTFLGFQLADPIYISLRQTAELSGLEDTPDHLYPGIDFKLRLAHETRSRPEISLGMNSAFGHKNTASEYIAFSKRYNNFDFTAGMAWGQLGSAGHIKNPLRALSSHFSHDRIYDNDNPQNINDWFTGKDIGFFGGVEYFTPWNGLSLKADYGANEYKNTRISDFNRPKPWSVGVNYQPWEQMDLSAAILGGEKIMARLSIQDNIESWPQKKYKSHDKPFFLDRFFQSSTKHDPHYLALKDFSPTVQQIANRAREAQYTDITSKKIILAHKGLRGPSVDVLISDITQEKRSPEEIWRNTSVTTGKDLRPIRKKILSNGENSAGFFRFILDNRISLSEEDTGPLYRSSAIVDYEKPMWFGLRRGGQFKVNLADDLSRLRTYRPQNISGHVTRSDEDDFAAQRFSVDKLYLSWLRNVTPNTYFSFTAGYLEEMYSGLGGEVLYRPFGKTYAIGTEMWGVKKRDPFSKMNLGSNGKERTTGHVNLYYEIPNTMMTAYGNIGRYLDGDVGTTLGFQSTFKNGAKLDSFITATDESDTDIFGGESHLYGGLRLHLPIGNTPYIPRGSEIRLTATPFARDKGQMLEHPLPLYDVTEPLSSRQIYQNWPNLLD